MVYGLRAMFCFVLNYFCSVYVFFFFFFSFFYGIGFAWIGLNWLVVEGIGLIQQS